MANRENGTRDPPHRFLVLRSVPSRALICVVAPLLTAGCPFAAVSCVQPVYLQGLSRLRGSAHGRRRLQKTLPASPHPLPPIARPLLRIPLTPGVPGRLCGGILTAEGAHFLLSGSWKAHYCWTRIKPLCPWFRLKSIKKQKRLSAGRPVSKLPASRALPTFPGQEGRGPDGSCFPQSMQPGMPAKVKAAWTVWGVPPHPASRDTHCQPPAGNANGPPGSGWLWVPQSKPTLNLKSVGWMP